MALSPMMQQYVATKEKYPDALVFYRLGDFYEMFFEDAKIASKVLELTLTGRDCGEEERAPMCGVPYHAADTYIGRLVKNGYKVVICEQMEDPATAKGLVRRDVVRVVTPGTVTDGAQLEESKNNYVCAFCDDGSFTAVCFADITTGELRGTILSGKDRFDSLSNELSAYMPKEIMLDRTAEEIDPKLRSFIEQRVHATVYDNQTECFETDKALASFRRRLGNPADYGSQNHLLVICAGALVGYADSLLRCDAVAMRELTVYSESQYLMMDANTRRNLEICETMRDASRKGSLMWVLDHTKTAMGARYLRRSLEQPLVHQKKILYRQDAVGELVVNMVMREAVGDALKGVLDLERLMTKVLYGSAGGKDLRAIAGTIGVLPEVLALLQREAKSEALADIAGKTDPLTDIYELIDRAIAKDPPFSVREGGFIADGYNETVDKLRDIQKNVGSYINSMEATEREKLGMKGVKIGYNRVFGYYIEVPRALSDQVPKEYIRKQTLANCERYITDELKQLESTILSASERDAALEYELFREICQKLTEALPRIQQSGSRLAELDMYYSLAVAAVNYGYTRPEITCDEVIDIKSGRHPVVERFVSDAGFVPNDSNLNTGSRRLMIITGPNMAGKSTYMRQVALIVLMAQMGSFVPADDARIGIVDKLFTRIGASDDLASGQSTFMLEMNEVAYILKNATRRSLVIYDEIGRGTSTYDGMSIAKTVAEYTASSKIGAKTLFATHYHELTTIADAKKGIVNYHITAKKKGDTVVFLRKIIEGAADDSYGIEVAKLAGVPSEVIKRAKQVLLELEQGEGKVQIAKLKEEGDTISIEDYTAKMLMDKVKKLDPDTMTPMEAQMTLYELKKMLK